MITADKATALLSRIDKRIKTHERFLMKIGYIMNLKYTDEQKQEILKNACWVDGTLAGQVQYAQEQRAKLRKSYSVLINRFIELKIIKRHGVY